jgi:hypothetical protein
VIERYLNGRKNHDSLALYADIRVGEMGEENKESSGGDEQKCHQNVKCQTHGPPQDLFGVSLPTKPSFTLNPSINVLRLNSSVVSKILVALVSTGLLPALFRPVLVLCNLDLSEVSERSAGMFDLSTAEALCDGTRFILDGNAGAPQIMLSFKCPPGQQLAILTCSYVCRSWGKAGILTDRSS